MADKIGVLGSSTTASVATTTAYTVPAAKAARVKIQWTAASHGSNSTGDLTITVNGAAVATRLNLTAARYYHSNSTLMVSAVETAAPTGDSAILTVAPAPFEYYLSAGDTVTYTVGTDALVSMNFQVVGTEIDV
jgi:hypothetical protein